jgi:hypothetical protein
MNRKTYLLLGVVIFVATLAAFTLWSLVVEQIVSAKLQSSASTNPLLKLITGS